MDERYLQSRVDYDTEGLDLPDLDPDPVAQLAVWLHTAQEDGLPEPNTMIVASATSDGRPSARAVLLKGLDERGLVFYTSYRSRKGAELAGESPCRSLLRVATASPSGEGGGSSGAGRRGRAQIPTSFRVPVVRKWVPPHRRRARSWPTGAPSTPRSSVSSRRPATARLCGRSGGVATGSSRRHSSSGRGGGTVSTTGSGTGSTLEEWFIERLWP